MPGTSNKSSVVCPACGDSHGPSVTCTQPYQRPCVQCERLKAAILDIDAHAVALGEDKDGWTSIGYFVSIGALHRALGVAGHPAAKQNGGYVELSFYVKRQLLDALRNLTNPLDHEDLGEQFFAAVQRASNAAEELALAKGEIAALVVAAQIEETS